METCFECGKRDHYFKKIGIMCVLGMQIHYLLIIWVANPEFSYFGMRIFVFVESFSLYRILLWLSMESSIQRIFIRALLFPIYMGFVVGGGMVIGQGLNFS